MHFVANPRSPPEAGWSIQAGFYPRKRDEVVLEATMRSSRVLFFFYLWGGSSKGKSFYAFFPSVRLRVPPLSLGPSCEMRKETAS